MGDLYEAVDLAVDTDPLKLRDALFAAINEHRPSVLTAGLLPGRFGEGRCAYCNAGHPLVREFRGHLNGESMDMHDHVDPAPNCITCASPDEYEAYARFPCATRRGIASALGIQEGGSGE